MSVSHTQYLTGFKVKFKVRKPGRLKIRIITWLLLSTTLLNAQLPDYHVQLFDESFGIRTSYLRRLTIDHEHFVWLLFPNHVQRFDGQGVRDYPFDDNLYFSFCDRLGRVWVASQNQVYRFDKSCDEFEVIRLDTLSSPDISLLCQPNEHDGLWVLTRQGFYIFNDDTQEFHPHPDPLLGHLNFEVNKGDVSEDGYVLQSPDSLIYIAKKDLHRYALPHPGTGIRWVCSIRGGKALVSLWRGKVILYDFLKNEYRELETEDRNNSLADNFLTIYETAPMNDSLLLLATSKGLFTFNDQETLFRKLRLYHKGKPLEGYEVFTDIHVDDPIAWLCYDNYGLIRFNLQHNEIGLIRNDESDPRLAWDNNARNMVEDRDGNIWIASFNGFTKWDVQASRFTPFFAHEGATDQLNHHSVRGIAYDGENIILGQTNKGVWIYNPNTKKYQRPKFALGEEGKFLQQHIDGNFINQVYTLRNGDHLISGGQGGYLLHRFSYAIELLKFEGAEGPLEFAYEDLKGNIWIGAYTETICLDSTLQKKFSIPASRTQGYLNALCSLDENTIFAGGDKGLYKITLTADSYTLEEAHPFFHSIRVITLFLDTKSQLWLCTSEGLFRYHLPSGEISLMSGFESIADYSFYPNSYVYNKEGILFLGSGRGILYFKPEQLTGHKDTLDLYIASAIAQGKNNRQILGFTANSLPYDQNLIEIEVECPYYENAQKLKYRYRLSGLHPGWINHDGNYPIRFHDLSPGRYVFEAAVSINGLKWFPAKEKLSWVIRPPFWNTWWFYLLMTAAVAALVMFIYRYQLNKRMEVEKLRMRIARDLHDDIGSAVSNIHIISAMAVNKSAQNGSQPLFAKIKDTSRMILDNMQDIVWTINPDNDSLEQVWGRIKDFSIELCESAGIECEFSLEDNLHDIPLAPDRRKELFLICKEAINNAVKYSEGNLIRISFRLDKRNMLHAQIADNGKGFESKASFTGNGLKNMHTRAEEVGGTLQISSTPGEGTIIDFIMPIT